MEDLGIGGGLFELSNFELLISNMKSSFQTGSVCDRRHFRWSNADTIRSADAGQ